METSFQQQRYALCLGILWRGEKMVRRNRVFLSGAIVIAAVLVGMTVPAFVPAFAASNSQSVSIVVGSNGGTYTIQANGGSCTIQFTPSGQVNNSTATSSQQPSNSNTNSTSTQSSTTTQQLPNNSSVHYNLPFTVVASGSCLPASSFGK